MKIDGPDALQKAKSGMITQLAPFCCNRNGVS